MRILLWFSVLVGSAQAYACEDLLRSQFAQIHGNQLVLNTAAEHNLQRMGLSEADLRRFTDANSVFVVTQSTGGMRTIVFEPNPSHADRGVLLTGYRSGRNYMITRVEWSHRDEEMEYFRAVAREHKLEKISLRLDRPILNCPNLVVDGWVQTKLWLKHRLNLKAVSKFIGFTHSEPVVDESYKGRKPRFEIRGMDAFNRQLLAVIGAGDDCENVLITAFEIR